MSRLYKEIRGNLRLALTFSTDNISTLSYRWIQPSSQSRIQYIDYSLSIFSEAFIRTTQI